MSYNPLRSVNKLNRADIEFPVSILCGSSDRGGHGGCEEFVMINKYFDSGQSQIFVVEEADETLVQNPKKLVELMVGYFTGSLTGMRNIQESWFPVPNQ